MPNLSTIRLTLVVTAMVLSSSFLIDLSVKEVSPPQISEAQPPREAEPLKPTPRTHLPKEVRGIYWTAYTAGMERANQLLEYMLENELNAVIIDLKMDEGEIAFAPENENLKLYARSKPVINDLENLLTRLYEHKIYRIARIAVMRDGTFAKKHPELALKRRAGGFWHDPTGVAWLDPAAQEVADYAIALGQEAYNQGFDEVQFDYVRFPSDGNVNGIVYPIHDGSPTKIEVMQEFFKKVGGAMQKEGIPVSFDLFGMTFWSTNDYSIGQRLLDVYPYADFVSPMVYPSHYPNGFEGYGNPALFPYEIVYQSLNKGAEQLLAEMGIIEEESRLKFRPWLQHFHIGAYYDAPRIQAQIDAARDAGASGWLLWNARNVYGGVLAEGLVQ